MSPRDDSALAAQLALLRSLRDKSRLTEDEYRAELAALGVSPDAAAGTATQIGRQINVAGNYYAGGPSPASSPTLDADTALSRYLRHIIEANRRLQLQGIRSTADAGLVSIELEEIILHLG